MATEKQQKHSSRQRGSSTGPGIRLFTRERLEAGRAAALTDEQQHYLIKVMRLGEEARLNLFSPDDGEWQGLLRLLSKRQAAVEILEKVRAAAPCPPLELIIAPLRKERTEWLTEKATELGVTQITFIATDYTQERRLKFDRLQRIATEAAEQCERLDVPQVSEPVKFDAWLKARSEPVLAAIERIEVAPLASTAEGLALPSLLIGPEGGFSPRETAALTASDLIRPVTFGERLLRAETAALAGLAILQSVKGRLELQA